MKATLETITGVTINRDIDTAESPWVSYAFELISLLLRS